VVNPSGSSTGPVRTAELLALAREWEPAVTDRALESWRHRGLIPHPHRVAGPGRGPGWEYPDHALPQLQALMRLRRQTKSTDLLLVGLWLEGFPITPKTVLVATTRALGSIAATVESELAAAESVGRTRREAIEAAGRTAAGLRGEHRPLPGYGRQTLAERRRALVTVFRIGLGDESVLETLDDEAAAVERTLGLDRGRRYRPEGVGPWLDGPAGEGLAALLQFGSIPRLIEVLRSATADEVEAVRMPARTLTAGLAAFCLLADAFSGQVNVTGMGAFAAAVKDPTAMVFLVAFLIAARRSPELGPGLQQVCEALERYLPMSDELRAIASLPAGERRTRLPGLANLEWPEERKIARIIEALEGDS
jgi:hypothetical protein